MRDTWHDETASRGNGDLHALVATFDRPATVAPFDDGLQRMLVAVAAMRSRVVRPR